jgi:hypothetical protein
VDGDQTWRQFTPFELVWAGGVLGRAAAQMRVWLKRLTEAAADRHARGLQRNRRVARAGAAEQGQSIVPPQSAEAMQAASPEVMVDATGDDPRHSAG